MTYNYCIGQRGLWGSIVGGHMCINVGENLKETPITYKTWKNRKTFKKVIKTYIICQCK